MDSIQEILSRNSNNAQVNLEFLEIEDFSQILEELAENQSLTELSLHGNRLTSLPQDLSALAQLKLLDISNNLIESVDDVLDGLKTLPQLSQLFITLPLETDREKILTALPNLTQLNKQEISEPNILDSIDFQVTKLKQSDLEQVTQVYEEIQGLYRQENMHLGGDLDIKIQEMMQSLSQQFQEPKPAHVVHTLFLSSKLDLYELCLNKLTDYIAQTNPQIGALLTHITSTITTLYSEFPDILNEIQPKFQAQFDLFKSQLEKATQETSEVLEAAEVLESQTTRFEEEKQAIRQTYKEEVENLRAEIETLQEENKSYLDMIIRHSKNKATTASNATTGREENLRETEKQRHGSVTANRSINIPIKTLTLKQLKDTIEEIYESKLKYDKQCIESKLARETMEQHMYTFLNQKYGLKKLTFEWAGAIIESCKKYESKDNEVAVFQRILRNECDEEFRFVQEQVKKTIVEILRSQLQFKHPLKSQSEITDAVRERVKGNIEQECWANVVTYMYSENDAETLKQKILTQINSRRDTKRPKSLINRKRMTRQEVAKLSDRERQESSQLSYSDFLKVLLDFQLEGHRLFLQPFVRIFKSADVEGDGTLTEYQFRQVVNKACGNTDLLTDLLQQIDPYDNQKITFSDCVTLFSSTEEASGKSVLQNLATSAAN